MAISKWQFIKAETDEFRERYLLKLNGSREDIVTLYKKYEKYVWVPFAINEEDYCWGIYVENTLSQEMDTLKTHLTEISHPVPVKKFPEKPKIDIPEKLEIVGSTWDWQKMQMDSNSSKEEEKKKDGPPEEHKNKNTPFVPSDENKFEELFGNMQSVNLDEPAAGAAPTSLPEEKPDLIPLNKGENPPPAPPDAFPGLEPFIIPQQEQPVKADNNQEKIHHSEEHDVGVNEIINELNKILADFTQSEPESRPAPALESKPSPFSLSEELNKQGMNEASAEMQEEQIKQEQPGEDFSPPSAVEGVQQVPADAPPKSQDDMLIQKDTHSWEELSNMFNKTVSESTEESLSDKEEEKIDTSFPEEPKRSLANVSEQGIDDIFSLVTESAESLVSPNVPTASEPAAGQELNVVSVAVLTTDGNEDMAETFRAHIAENLNKMSKGSMTVKIVLTLGLNGQGFDTQQVIQELGRHDIEMIFFIGFEQASAYKMEQLNSFIETKKIEKKNIKKEDIDKKFIYLDLTASMMILKKKLNDE